MNLQNFRKPPLTHQQHLSLIQDRGLFIEDYSQATHYLEYVGYYRLSGYFWFFYDKSRNENHNFVQGATFKNIVDLYEFDTSVRSLLLRAVERIEVAARATISNVMCEQYGSHWYLTRDLFKSNFRYDEFIAQVKRETEFLAKGGRKPIFKSYYSKYDKPELPASWMVCEVLSIGALSRVYEYIRKSDAKKTISKKFALPHYEVFSSWLQAICFIRNLCAHHSMVCYRKFHITPVKPIDWTREQQKIFTDPKSFFLQLSMIQYLLHSVAPDIKLLPCMIELTHKYPEISTKRMGFEPGWESYEVWK